jgi:hypothetical protein
MKFLQGNRRADPAATAGHPARDEDFDGDFFAMSMPQVG